nr:Concanavalin A-like lectin/glucanase, subgroup [Ipomoea batatas]GMC52038.1 Concanavalin A-like lectin/glucanase, subgroup [Ipomoea batatas]GMC54733.1 Concanavalin A-like lectin/glucanase, subgroup [Ipomoea batatas]
MGCFRKSKKKAGQQQNKKSDDQIPSTLDKQKLNLSLDEKKEAPGNGDAGHIAAHTFTFRELAAATKNFRVDCLLGEGGFGRVYKGQLQSTSQIVAIKQLDRDGLQGNREFLVEARPLFKDRRKFSHMADPTLQGQYPMRGMYQALAVAAMCVHEQPNMRPLIADVVTALNYLASQKYGSDTHPVQKPWFGSSTTR